MSPFIFGILKEHKGQLEGAAHGQLCNSSNIRDSGRKGKRKEKPWSSKEQNKNKLIIKAKIEQIRLSTMRGDYSTNFLF